MASAPLEGGETAAALRDAGSRAHGPSFNVSPWRSFESEGAIEEWDALARAASEPNPFCESWNLLPALAAFARNGAVDLALLRIDGELCALMPLARCANYYGYPIPNLGNWSHDNLFVGSPLVRRGFEELFWRELFAWADRHPGGALFLHLDRLVEDGPLLTALARVADSDDREWAVVHREERALLRSELDPEAYFEASLSGKKRKELRRQHKRLSEAGALRFDRQAGAEGLDAWIAQFLALEQAGWKGRNRSALADHAATRAWFAQAMHGATAHGRLERLALSLDGAPIALLANFVAPPGAFSFKTAFDERFARFSPGVLLQRENLDLLARGDIDWCDSCAAADHPMIERIWREKRAMVRINVAIGGPLRRKLFRQVLRAELRKQALGVLEMGVHTAIEPRFEDARAQAFDAAARATFAANYPETPHVLRHGLAEHDLLTLDALANLAGRLPVRSIEYNRGDLPIGVDGKPGGTGLSIEDTIRHIARSNSWAVLKNVEQAPEYEALLLSLLGEIRAEIEAKTGAMLRPQAFVFISSPSAVTPYHFDPEHNILLQLVGRKTMTQFPAGDPHFAPDTIHESYHAGGARELTWRDELAAGGREFPLCAGEAVYVPVMAPHFVRNGPESSISLSITWRSDWSFAEADARGFNRLLRRAGLSPAAPERWPASNRPKALAFRALRRLGIGD